MTKLLKFTVLLLTAILIMTGCANDRNTNENPAGGEGNKNLNDKNMSTEKVNVEPIISMRDYFPPDGSRGHFSGEGNKFATYDIEVMQPHKDYFVLFEDNGGTITRRIYKVQEDRIDILDTNVVGIIEKNFPSLHELDSMESSGIYLQQPFSIGTMFDEWTIMETGLTVETPYQTFDNVFVIESKEKGAVNRKYFASGFGEIKRESAMKTGDGEIVTITSRLDALGTE